MAPRLIELNDEPESKLMWIGTEVVAKAQIQGMRKGCFESTVEKMRGNAGWRAEIWIPEGAVEKLMVVERMMLPPDSE